MSRNGHVNSDFTIFLHEMELGQNVLENFNKTVKFQEVSDISFLI